MAVPPRARSSASSSELPRLVELGITVVELLPVHQNDPQEGSYWGYMPLAFAAVDQRLAAGDDAHGELAAFVSAAHDHDIEVWLDVVFNHTTEVDATGPTYNLRGLSDGAFYRLRDDGSYIETTGCGNDLDVTSADAQDLVIWSLDRLADLGVDGFRFDLAAGGRPRRRLRRPARPVGGRPRRGAGRRAVGRRRHHLLGRTWPGHGWLQWNDRFRDDLRGFLRGEAGLSPPSRSECRAAPTCSRRRWTAVNFLTCHDGFTLYDLVAYDHKRNDANGWGGRDGADHNRSWNCGWEGDDGVPADVARLRRRQLRNAWCLLAMSHGVPMVAMGDEHGRTQGGNNNAYNQDNETSWVDWDACCGLRRSGAVRAGCCSPFATVTRCCRGPSGGARM